VEGPKHPRDPGECLDHNIRTTVVAGLLCIGLDKIVRPPERARRRRNQLWPAVAGVFLVLAVAAIGSTVYAWQLRTNDVFLNATLKRATEIVRRIASGP
jgi:hypothetical protein